jgi:hypothetical protein
MTHSNEYLAYKVLEKKYSDRGYDLVDHAIATGLDVPVRQMCAKVHPVLYQRMQDACDNLGISQRRFIESAVANAIHEAEDLLAEHFPGGES